MTTISRVRSLPRKGANRSCATKLASTLMRWWIAYTVWRVARVAIRQLWAMSDHGLKDIGLVRSGIPNAVRDHAIRAREFSRNHW
jgi:uncharacterized protein YjiS (DUF1127 family)